MNKEKKEGKSKWEGRRFCSNTCSVRSRHEKDPNRKYCTACNGPIPKRHDSDKYCSVECKTFDKNYSKKCEHCGIIFYKRRGQGLSTWEKQNTCSRGCGNSNGNDSRDRSWSTEDKEVLKQFFHIGPKTVQQFIKTARTIEQVRDKASSLGVTKKIPNVIKILMQMSIENWDDRDDTVVKELYPTKGREGVHEILKWRSLINIDARAEELGLTAQEQEEFCFA